MYEYELDNDERDQAIRQIIAAGHQARIVNCDEIDLILVRRCQNGEPMKDAWDTIYVMYYDQWLDSETEYQSLVRMWESVIATSWRDSEDDHSNFGIM